MTRIGRYEIERELGRGAMGVVYLAHDPRLRRHAALKVVQLPDGIAAAERVEFLERFVREAQAAAALTHPGIVTVYDADVNPGGDDPFIAMEYVEGRSLREILDTTGRLAPPKACALAHDVADALGAAHRGGIIHRDIKPANLLLREEDGAAKIADFGVARLPSSELTRSDRIPGSPAYMSPEQIRGREVDGRSDLFSLAVVLYEALAGERPFRGNDVSELAYSVVHENPVPITRLVPELSAAFDAFFERALAKDPAARFPDAASFRDEIRRAQASRASDESDATRIDAQIPEEPPPSAAPWVESFTADEETDGLAGPLWAWGRWSRIGGAAGLLVLVAILLAAFAGMGGVDLRLDARSTFQDATLRLLVDGEEVYSRDLRAPERPSGTLGKLKNLIDDRHESFEAWIRVEPGKHEIVALVVPSGFGEPYQDTIAVELDPGEKRRLKLIASEKKSGGSVSIRLGAAEE